MHKLWLLLGLVCSPAWALDINTAATEELQSVKGIGPGKAKAIIEYRQANGSFKSIDELAKVKGFGANSPEKFKGDLTVGNEAKAGKNAANPAAAKARGKKTEGVMPATSQSATKHLQK